MAGQPKRRAMIEELERRTRDYFEIDPVDLAIGSRSVPSHLDYVTAYLKDGHTLKELAFDIGQTLGYEIGRERVSAYLKSTWGGEAETELANARAHASHPMAERALEVVTAQADDSVDVARAASQARVLMRLAEAYDPSSYGQQKGPTVSISIASLHLDALRAVQGKVTVGAPVAVTASRVTRDEAQQA